MKKTPYICGHGRGLFFNKAGDEVIYKMYMVDGESIKLEITTPQFMPCDYVCHFFLQPPYTFHVHARV